MLGLLLYTNREGSDLMRSFGKGGVAAVGKEKEERERERERVFF